MISEAKLQYEIVQWSQQADYYCFHCPNGEKRDKITGNKLMAMGVKAGVPDLIFILNDGITLWVEIKLKKGRLRTVQEKFKKLLLEKHHHYLLIQTDDVDEAIALLKKGLAKYN